MEFDSQFGSCAEEFHNYRPDYPDALYARMFAEVADDCRQCAMDLGAGTGIVTKHLIPGFREVIAVEPDLAMGTTLLKQLPQVKVYKTTAEECVQDPGSVDLITIANALHWMDFKMVFANAHDWLRPRGVVAVFDRPLPKSSPEIDAITMSEFRGSWKPHRDPRLKGVLTWKDQLRTAHGFVVVFEGQFPHKIPLSPAEFVGFWRSTSYGNAYARTLSEPEKYWNQLQERFSAASAMPTLLVDFTSTLILLRKTQV
jgi:trans-aconitate methyltransferase